ncbi:MAG: arsenic resistance N-acetyltransferase ArsN2 [Candidatus Eisenbacteria bacterium]
MNERMLPTVVIRPARPADRESIDRLLVAAKLPLAGVADPVAEFLVASTSDGLVGTVGVECYPPFGLLRSVAVDESQRGRGLGALLVARAIQRARLREIATLYLLTTSAADYFPRFGFRTVARAELPAELLASEELKGAYPETAVCMELPIAN